MKLTDLNRDGGIGANSLFVQLGDLNILVDCGLHPKKVGRAAAPDLAPLRGRTLEAEFVRRLRPEKKFPAVAALVAQIRRDTARAKAVMKGRLA